MQAVVDRMIRAFTNRCPPSDERSNASREDAAEFAAELLETYKNRLTRRSLGSAANH